VSERVADGLDEALKSAGDGACAIRGDGRIALWNRAAERILGYTAREAVGRLCCDLFVGFDDSGNRLCYRGCHVMKLVEMGDPVQSFRHANAHEERTRGVDQLTATDVMQSVLSARVRKGTEKARRPPSR
jgi:PAS domain S-box-containing protein